MTRLRLGLRERLVGLVLAILIVLLVSLAAVVLTRTERALRDVDRDRAARTTEQLALGIATGVLARSEVLLAPTLDAFAASPDVVAVRVVDDTGAVIAARGRAPEDEGLTLTLEAPVVARASDAAVDELAAFGAGEVRDEEVGRVTVTFSRARTLAIGRLLTRHVALTFVGLGVLGLVLVLAVAASVVRRVRALAAAAARVKDSALDVEVDARGTDELAALAHDFNAMTRALAAQRAALDEAAEQLAEREALAGIGRATAVIAHELNNPLGIVLGAADVAADAGKPAAAREKALGILSTEVRRLDATLRQLLNHARPATPAPRVVDAAALVAAAVERAGSEGGPLAGLAVTVAGRAGLVRVDEGHAHQILLNLFTNAAQAGARAVVVTLAEDDARVSVRVKDDGPGVDPGIAPRLFSPFLTTKQRGAGLGLSGSRRLARDNGGELALVPDDGGACFVLTLPRAPREAP